MPNLNDVNHLGNFGRTQYVYTVELTPATSVETGDAVTNSIAIAGAFRSAEHGATLKNVYLVESNTAGTLQKKASKIVLTAASGLSVSAGAAFSLTQANVQNYRPYAVIPITSSNWIETNTTCAICALSTDIECFNQTTTQQDLNVYAHIQSSEGSTVTYDASTRFQITFVFEQN